MKKEKVLAHATVCFLKRKGNEILLAIKKKNIGEGFWNGYGGGIKSGETPRQAAVREIEEETKEKEEEQGVIVLPEDLEKIAEIDFHNFKTDGGTFVCKVHFYLAEKWEGEPREGDEMKKPTWFSMDNLPLDEMMPADKKWLPVALSGKKVKASPKLGPFQKELLEDFEIIEVDCFEVD